MKTFSYLLTTLLASTLFLSANCSAQQDQETASRQAQIDADEAQVKIDQIQKNANDAYSIDGADAPTLQGDEDRVQRLSNLEQRDRIAAQYGQNDYDDQ